MSRRHAVSMVELLIATAILGGAVMIAYGWLQQDFRFGVDLGSRETADTLTRNMLERFRRMPPEQMMRLVGEDGEVNAEDLNDPTLNAVDLRTADELQRLGFQRSIRAWRSGGPLGRVSFSVRTSWPSVDGRRREFVYGVAQVTGADLAQKSAGRSPSDAGGFRRREQNPDWGRAKGWSTAPPSGGTAGTDTGGTHSGSSTGGSGGSSTGGSSGGSPRRGGRRTRTDRLFGGSRLDDLVRKAAKGATAVGRDYKPERAPPTVTGDAGLIEATTGEEGVMARSYREAVARLRATSQAREETFLARASASNGGGSLGNSHVPAGDYTYVLEVLDLRRQTPPRMVGVFRLRGEGDSHHLVDRRARGRHTLGGEDVIAEVFLADDQAHSWDLLRSEEQLILIERPKGFFPARLLVRDLPGPDGGAQGTVLTRRAVAALVGKQGLGKSSGRPTDLLEVAAQRGSF